MKNKSKVEPKNMSVYDNAIDKSVGFIKEICIAGVVATFLIVLHTFILHGIFSWLFASIFLVFIIGYFIVKNIQSRQVKEGAWTIPQRVAVIERKLGTDASN